MTKKKKIMATTLASIVGLIAVWFTYQYITAKPVDPALEDACVAASRKGDLDAVARFCPGGIFRKIDETILNEIDSQKQGAQ